MKTLVVTDAVTRGIDLPTKKYFLTVFYFHTKDNSYRCQNMLHVARSNKSTSSSDILSWQDHLCTKLILIIMSIINEATFSYLSKKFSLSCPSKVAVSVMVISSWTNRDKNINLYMNTRLLPKVEEPPVIFQKSDNRPLDNPLLYCQMTTMWFIYCKIGFGLSSW